VTFVFVSGNLALDFVGTLKWRRGDVEELLAVPGDLARWAVEAGVLTEEPEVDGAGLRRLRTLREAVYRLVGQGMRGLPWNEDDLRVVNKETGATPARMSLSPDGVVRLGGVGAIAADVACSAVELLGDIGNLPIKECGDPECTRIFIDRSRGGNRQWCGMEECGNRVKAAAYRSRKAKV
jgi:predicted RNA-binding Zn ribbon-like protein